MTKYYNVDSIACKRGSFGLRDPVTYGCNIFTKKQKDWITKSGPKGTHLNVTAFEIFPNTKVVDLYITKEQATIHFGENVICSAGEGETRLYCSDFESREK